MDDARAGESALPQDLGDGLVLRRGRRDDLETLPAFMAEVFGDPASGEPDDAVAPWTRDLLRGDHPTFRAADFSVVEDTRRGRIASALGLISQTWTYGGIPFGVGQPELVATHTDYRRRGLVRAQFAAVHAWSAARGELVQVIAGIPWFYRQFGYELGIPRRGGRMGYLPQVPRLAPDAAEPYHVRPATPDDLPLFATLDAAARGRELLGCVRDAALWRYELDGHDAQSTDVRRALCVVETAAGAPVGILTYPPRLWGTMLAVLSYELLPGLSWLAVTPSVLRYLAATGAALAAQTQKEFGAFLFGLGFDHPVYAPFRDLLPQVRRPGAWYVRVPDLPAFLTRVAPVLEARLAASALAGQSGELRLNFYRSGLRLAFTAGRLTAAAPWAPEHAEAGSAAFPDLTFLQLLFGYRSLDDLEYAFADCWVAGTEPRALLNALFPRQSSNVWPVG